MILLFQIFGTRENWKKKKKESVFWMILFEFCCWLMLHTFSSSRDLPSIESVWLKNNLFHRVSNTDSLESIFEEQKAWRTYFIYLFIIMAKKSLLVYLRLKEEKKKETKSEKKKMRKKSQKKKWEKKRWSLWICFFTFEWIPGGGEFLSIRFTILRWLCYCRLPWVINLGLLMVEAR